ncbi:MAG: alpha/beta fold hydrolase [Flavobacteriales bacterium]|nr:alpha/beta fold hydrolase [Flavobacteriales bacterium]
MRYYVDIKGVHIHYQNIGKGEPLILLHGLGMDGSLWDKHVAEYKKHFRCIVIEQRGVGRSSQPPGPYTTAMMADDVVAVMEHAKVDKARIAGISMGGAIAQELALNHPEKVRSMVLISTWPKFNNFATTVYENLKKLRITSEADTFKELMQLWIYSPLYYKEGKARLAKWQKVALNDNNPQSQNGFEGQIDACINHDTMDRLRRIKVPTLITCGEQDIITPTKFSKFLRHNIINSQFVSFPEGGHAHHWENLEKFNKVTTDFFLKN